MTDDEIERIRARLDTADALDPREGGRVGRVLLAALDEARAERDRAREHVAALQRCLGERSPDEPVSYAQAVGAAMREAIAAERDRARREAIEACIARVEEAVAAYIGHANASGTTHDWLTDVADGLREMLDNRESAER